MQSLLSYETTSGKVSKALAKRRPELKALIEADEKLIQQQQAAFNEAFDTSSDNNGYSRIYNNDGTNALGRAHKNSGQSDVEQLSRNFLQNVLGAVDIDYEKEMKAIKANEKSKGGNETITDSILQKIDAVPSEQLTKEQKLALKTMVVAQYQLESIDTKKLKFNRNRSEYEVALKKMLVEGMGGLQRIIVKAVRTERGKVRPIKMP